MSTATVRAAPAPRRAAPTRPELRLVPARSVVAGRVPFAVVVAVILLGGLVGLLVLHTAAAQDAFQLQNLQRQTATLADTEQQLAVSEQQSQSPSQLAARARALGMVPTGSIAFMRMRSGRIVGVAKAAPAPPPPAPAATPSASPSRSSTSASKHHHQHVPTAHR